MNATHLHNADGSPANVARCGKCGRLWEPQYAPISGGKHGKRNWTPAERYEYTVEKANKCCNWRCEICNEPAWSTYQVLCREHLNAQMAANDQEREAKAFAKAKPAEEEGPLWYGDRIFQTMEDLLDHLDGEELPEYVWCAKRIPLCIDVDSVIENATQDHHESVSEAIGNEDRIKLQKLCDEWCESIRAWSYEVDYSRYVMLPKTVKGA